MKNTVQILFLVIRKTLQNFTTQDVVGTGDTVPIFLFLFVLFILCYQIKKYDTAIILFIKLFKHCFIATAIE